MHYVSLVLDIRIHCVLKRVVISIPVILLWNVKIALRRKLTLWGILCLSIFTAITAIIKIAGGNINHGQVDSAWAIFWFQAEAAIAVLVVSISAYRALFVAHRASKRQSPAQRTYTGPSIWSKNTKGHKEWPGVSATSPPGVTTDIQSPYGAKSFEASQDMELPLRGPGILVTQDISSNQVGSTVDHEINRSVLTIFRLICPRSASPLPNHLCEDRFAETEALPDCSTPQDIAGCLRGSIKQLIPLLGIRNSVVF